MVQLSQSQDDEIGDGTTGKLVTSLQLFMKFSYLLLQVLWCFVAPFLSKLSTFLTKESMPSGNVLQSLVFDVT